MIKILKLLEIMDRYNINKKVCFCSCHQYPGVYRCEPCNICGHYNSNGKLKSGYNNGWEEQSLEDEFEEWFYKPETKEKLKAIYDEISKEFKKK